MPTNPQTERRQRLKKILDKLEPEVADPMMFHTSPGATTRLSLAISMKRIADALDSSDMGGRPQGSVLWWLEQIAGRTGQS